MTMTSSADNKSVQEVIKNLRISHIEIRSDSDLDVKQYINTKNIEVIAVCIMLAILKLIYISSNKKNL